MRGCVGRGLHGLRWMIRLAESGLQGLGERWKEKGA